MSRFRFETVVQIEMQDFVANDVPAVFDCSRDHGTRAWDDPEDVWFTRTLSAVLVGQKWIDRDFAILLFGAKLVAAWEDGLDEDLEDYWSEISAEAA